MNKIQCKITNIVKSGNVALVKLNALISSANSNTQLTAIVLDFGGFLANLSQNHASNPLVNQTQNLSANLAIGAKCNAIFKESEVMIALLDSRVSARNCFQARISDIECDEIFARIFLDFHTQTITSLITKEARDALKLNIGDEILWFVKSNEVMLEFN